MDMQWVSTKIETRRVLQVYMYILCFTENIIKKVLLLPICSSLTC